MITLVIGGTGQVGREVLPRLAARPNRGHVRLLLRTGGRPLPAGVEPVFGDLLDPASLDTAFKGVGALFLLTPLGEEETRQGLNAVHAARRAGVGRVVYLTVHDIASGLHIPHFASKLPVIEAIRASGMAWTFLEPNNYFQNDLAMTEAILRHGVYPQPIGTIGISRVDVRDIADAAANALADERHAGRGYPLVGPDILTGEDVATYYAGLLGRPVAYAGDDLDAWEAGVRSFMPDTVRRDLRIMYRHFQDRGLRASAGDLAATTAILGRPPRRFADFAAGVAKTEAVA
jgi:uncharacterized protein YbjT (DUF2867 family)